MMSVREFNQFRIVEWSPYKGANSGARSIVNKDGHRVVVLGALMGLALDPAFQSNGRLYVMYGFLDPGGNMRNRVSRLVESNGSALAPHRGNLFFATLRGTHLHRVVLTGPSPEAAESEERLLEG
ncbi:MAG: hypothetical protein HY675_05705 [Chloroflexi bacterium]|nr:hypothetical protein [Chloroflexota bacterium]